VTGIRGGVAVCAHDGFANLSIVQYVTAAGIPIPVATLQLDQAHSYSVAAALIEAVGPTDLLDEQLRKARGEVLLEVRSALLEELQAEHPEFPAEFTAGLTAGINTAIQRVDALRAPASPKENPNA
jgi:hypothetical protein